MTKIRWIVWGAVACTLVAVGVGIYEAQPREPLWQTAHKTRTPDEIGGGSVQNVHFSKDGASVISFARRLQMTVSLTTFVPEVLEPMTVAVWDRETGKKLAHYPKTGRFSFRPEFSSDHRYCVGHVWSDDMLWINFIDLGSAHEIKVPMRDPHPAGSFAFSPNAEFVIHHEWNLDDEVRFLSTYETATGKLLDRRATVGVIGFANDYLVLLKSRNDNHSTAELWSLKNRKADGTFARPGWHVCGLSRDRQTLILSKGEVLGPDNGARWNLATRQFKMDRTAWCQVDGFVSSDGKWFGHNDGRKLAIHEIATGELNGSADLRSYPSSFSPDNRFLAASFEYDRFDPALPTSHALKVFAVPSMEQLWQTKWEDTSTGIAFSQDGCTIYAAFKADEAISLFDTESGESRGTVDLPCIGSTRFEQTGDKRYLLIHRDDNWGGPAAVRSLPQQIVDWFRTFFPNPAGRTRETIVVVDTASNRERFRLSGWDCSGAWLSDDGTTLITADSTHGVMRCWHVGPKPLYWAIGIPAAIGVVLIALVWRYTRWRRKKA